MPRLLLSLIVTILTTGAALAQSSAPVDVLVRALGLPDIVAIMHEEGVRYGADLDRDLLDGRGGSRWSGIVEEIYDPDQMMQTVRNRLDTELAAEDLAPMIAFFTSERGRRIVDLEVSARRALLDPGVDKTSRAALDEMILAHDPRLDLIRDFAAANELIENNVVGTMNSNVAFYRGLSEAGAFAGTMSEDEILADVWSQEQAIRDDTREWLYSYLVLAYEPLSDADLRAYTAFSETRAGRAVNRALFAAFDEMFARISLTLGRSAAELKAGQEL